MRAASAKRILPQVHMSPWNDTSTSIPSHPHNCRYSHAPSLFPRAFSSLLIGLLSPCIFHLLPHDPSLDVPIFCVFLSPVLYFFSLRVRVSLVLLVMPGRLVVFIDKYGIDCVLESALNDPDRETGLRRWTRVIVGCWVAT